MSETRGTRRMGRPVTSSLPAGWIAVILPVLAVTGALTAVLVAEDRKRLLVIMPVAAVAAAGLIALALVEFEWFVLATLALRAVVDVTKGAPSGNAIGSTGADAGSSVSSGAAASLLAVLFIVMSALWLLAQRRSQGPARLTFPEAAFGFFVVACLASLVSSVNRVAGLTDTMRIIAAILMFVVLARMVRTRRQMVRVLVACFVALIAPVSVGLLQAVSGRGRFVSDGISRVLGTFLHPNTFGFFLSMFALMGIALFRHASNRAKVLLVVTVTLCIVLLVLTYSRGSWLAFILGLCVLGVLQSRQIFAWLVGGCVVALAALPTVLGRITNLDTGSTINGSAGNSFTWRLQFWGSVVTLNDRNPVTGIGLKGTKELTDQNKAPHNDFLRAYVETGALGLLAYLLVLVALVVIARRAIQAAQAGLERGVAVGFAAVLVAYVVDSLGANLLSEVAVLWYFYAFAACACAIARNRPPGPMDGLAEASPTPVAGDLLVTLS